MSTTPTTLPPQDPFAFPEAQRNAIDKRLREFVRNDNIDLVSVRPERQKAAQQQIVQPRVASAPHMIPTPVVPSTPMQDPEAISLDLPSKFHYYDFKDLYVKPFRVFHLSKLAKANETGSLQSMVEAVSCVLTSSTTKDPNLAFKLTTADFNAVLFWLRLNSYGKKQMRVESVCTNPAHMHRVEKGEATQESLRIITTFTESMLDAVSLDEVPDPEHYHVMHEGQRIELRPETMASVVEFLDHPKMQDEEFQYLVQVGAVLNIPGNIEQRANFAATLAPDQALIALDFAKKLDAYGVTETVKTKCTECGASGAVQIAVDAPSFLSPEF